MFRKIRKRLNALDIAVIAVIFVIAASTAAVSLKGGRKSGLEIEITFVSDIYKSEIFDGIEEDIRIFDFSSGECLGTVSMAEKSIERGEGKIEIKTRAAVSEAENGFLINNTRFYKGEKLSVIAGDSCIAALITDFKKYNQAT